MHYIGPAMNETYAPALMPAGFADLLPPDAETAAQAIASLLAVFAGHGYARVQPPLLEFEDTLFAGSGAALAEQSFRMMDPESHRMMALRADITPQVARIAATRMAAAPRPMRLSYSGPCVRTRGIQRDPIRQIIQAGIELMGHDSAAADAEVILVGAEALAAIGLRDLSIDLTMPTLAPAYLAMVPPARKAALAHALDRKDETEVASLAGDIASPLTALMRAAGPAEAALSACAAVALPPEGQAALTRLQDVIALLRAQAPSLVITVDPLEFRGLGYHTGLAFTIYARGPGEELGRGGRYVAGAEPATGLTLFADNVLRAAPLPQPRRTLFIPFGQDGATWRAQGFRTVAGLAPADDAVAEARRLRCLYCLVDGQPSLVKGG